MLNPETDMGERSAASQLNVQYVTDPSGEKTAVILPLGEFEELMEDLEDLAALAERRDEPTTSHEDFLAELKRDGPDSGRGLSGHLQLPCVCALR